MNVLSRIFACTLLTLGVPAVAQDTPQPLGRMQTSPLLYIDDTVITTLQFADYLAGAGVIPSGVRERDLDTLRGCLEALIDQTVILLDMDSSGLLANPESARRARWRQAQVTGPIITSTLIAPHTSVSDSDIAQFHRDSLKTLFTAPRRRELSQILIAPQWEENGVRRQSSHAAVERARAQAESLLVALQAGARFDSLAYAFSAHEESQRNGGYLGWVFPGNTIRDFDTAAFAGEVGEIRGPVKTTYGYHLIRIENERPESTIALNDTLAVRIRRQLEYTQIREMASAWADSALAASQWVYNDEALARIPDIPDETWLVLVNGRDTLWYGEWKNAWQFYKRQQEISDEGTLEQKHASLRKSAFPFLYIQTAEDYGFADHPTIVGERIKYLQSETIRKANAQLRELQTPLEMAPLPQTDSLETADPSLHLQMIRARDTASIWAAYRRLVAGDSMAVVARWYHDNMREVRAGRWDLGWVGKEALPARVWGAAWILGKGDYTRPIEADGKYYIIRLADRPSRLSAAERDIRYRNEVMQENRSRGMAAWRKEIRAGHVVRINPSTWRRVQQLWRR